MTRRHAEILAVLFFVIVIGVVFQQISTSMVEQGIASGSPYDNAAAYPRAVALLMAGLLVVAAVPILRGAPSEERVSLAEMKRPLQMLAIFAVYLWALGWFGYHLATTPMLIAMLWIAGYRKVLFALIFALAVSFGLAFLFEVFLKIVLPGGIWRLNIPW